MWTPQFCEDCGELYIDSINMKSIGQVVFVISWLPIKNKEERYSRVPRLSDTRYSAIWRYASSKARLKCATYRRSTDLSVIGVRVGVANFFWINR